MHKKDGSKKNKRGYDGDHVLVKSLNHPASRKGWVPEHRVVVEKREGRYLKSNEIVHHIDLIKSNNHSANLCLFDDHASHFSCHGSLNKCVAKLMESGCLIFNEEKKIYEANIPTIEHCKKSIANIEPFEE